MDENVLENAKHRPAEELENQEDGPAVEKDNDAFDLEDEISEEEVELEEEPAKKKKKKKRSTFIDDAAEEDENDRKLKRSRFIDDIAEVDDEDEDDDDDEEGMDDLIADEGEAPDAVDLAEVRRAHREAEEQLRKEEEINPEALQQYLNERFGRDRVTAYARGEEADASGAVAQQALMPTIGDPKLWVVRCVDGTERELVVCLLQKCYDYAAKGQPLSIKSVFTKDHLKGYIYVEAHRDAHVREALKGFRSVFSSKPPRLVPLDEMVAAITVIKSTAKTIDPGSWVRVKAGIYKGDLAQVEDVDVNAGRAVVKFVPRIDYSGMAHRRRAGDETGDNASFSKQPKMRPAPRAFRPDEARNFKLDVQQQRDRHTGDLHYILNGSQRFNKGYLIKTVALKSIVLEKSIPPLDELQRFNAIKQDEDGTGTAGSELQGLAGLVADAADVDVEAALAKYQKGDRVIVVDGDLKGIKGTVEHITEDGQILVVPKDETLAGFKDAISFSAKEISKFFESGDHVKVVNGSHAGETGMVVRVDSPICIIFTDATKEEIKVFERDLTEAVTVATTIDSIGDYNLFDLVLLDSNTVGVIVNVDKDSCKVLTNQGRPGKPDVRVCRLPDLKRKINNRRATAIDGTRNEVAVGDIVEILDGAFKSKSGTVKHIMRGFLFIQSRELTENGGFMSIQARQCKVRGGKHIAGAMGGVLATPARSLATPAYSANVLASPAHHNAMGAGGGGGGGGGYAGRTATQQDRLLEGREVTIKKGPYRGMSGKIKNATGTHVRVELQAQMKTVTVSREYLAETEGGVVGNQRQTMGMGMGMDMYAAAPGGATPGHWSSGITATPAHYSAVPTATPLHPGMTPSRDVVTKTPAYDAAWAMTPAYEKNTEDYQQGGFSGMPGFGAAPPTSYGTGFGMAPPVQQQQQQPSSASYNANISESQAELESQAPVKGPVSDASPADWSGLEIILPSGEHAVVRSITASTGDLSVQIGKSSGDGFIFTGGNVRGVHVDEVKLAPYKIDDKVMVFGGKDGKGEACSVVLINSNEIFVKNGAGDIQVVQATMIAKIAADHSAS